VKATIVEGLAQLIKEDEEEKDMEADHIGAKFEAEEIVLMDVDEGDITTVVIINKTIKEITMILYQTHFSICKNQGIALCFEEAGTHSKLRITGMKQSRILTQEDRDIGGINKLRIREELQNNDNDTITTVNSTTRGSNVTTNSSASSQFGHQGNQQR